MPAIPDKMIMCIYIYIYIYVYLMYTEADIMWYQENNCIDKKKLAWGLNHWLRYFDTLGRLKDRYLLY